MFKVLLIAVPFLVLILPSNGLDSEKFLKENCDLRSSYRITCSFVNIQEEDNQEIQLKKFTISNATRFEFQNSKLVANGAFFEKFPNAIEFSFKDSSVDLTEKTLRAVQPHSNLVNLIIKDSTVENYYYEKGLESLTNLRYLYFDQVRFRSSFYNGFFQQMPQLQTITIQNCFVPYFDEYALKGLSKLSSLRLVGINKLKLTSYFFGGLESLGQLELASSGLEQISANAFPSSLWSLELRNNSIRFISRNMFSKSTSLSRLDLSFNNITIVSPSAFSNIWGLRYLFLQNNKINTFNRNYLEGNKGIIELDLSNNEIEKIPNDFTDDLVNLESFKY